MDSHHCPWGPDVVAAREDDASGTGLIYRCGKRGVLRKECAEAWNMDDGCVGWTIKKFYP